MEDNSIRQHPGVHYDDVYRLIKKIDQDKVLEKSTYIDLWIVRNCRKNNPLYSNSQAIRSVFMDVINKMSMGSEKQQYYAWILKGRFWDKHSIIRMTMSDRSGEISERTFSTEQRKAIIAFTEILTSMEQECLKQNLKNEVVSDGEGKDNEENQHISPYGVRDDTSQSRKVGTRYLISGFLSIVLLLFWILIIRIQWSGDVVSHDTSASIIGTSVPTETKSVELLESASQKCPGGKPFPLNIVDSQFLRSQGIITFDKGSTPGILNNKVRTVLVDEKGVWIGFFTTDEDLSSGLSYFDKENKQFIDCSRTGITAGQNINDIVIDKNQTLWIGMEKGGIASLDGKNWRLYKTIDGLPSDWIYGLFVDDENRIWAATYKGVARMDETGWKTIFSVENGSLVNDRVHLVTMDSKKNIWIGYIEDSLSIYHPVSGTWEHFSKDSGDIVGNKIRQIIFDVDPVTQNEIAWVATFENGISRYENGFWTGVSTSDGLPSNEVRDIAIDKHGRLWAATAKGVVYYVDNQWLIYDHVDTFHLAFGRNCQGYEGYCLDDENIFTGTNLLGLTHSRIPLPDEGLDVTTVCYVFEGGKEICPDLVKDNSQNMVISNLPEPMRPGTKFFIKISVSPHRPYQLLESRGDQLINIDVDNSQLFGSFPRIPVAGSIEAGQEFTFIDYNNPFVAPVPENGDSNTYFSNWRTWAQTRLIGPAIRVSFTVSE